MESILLAYDGNDKNIELASAETLQFRVSTGLKRVLGSELITDDDVAIFELVKNSFDAGAKEVYLHFAEDSITIADNGCGMSYDDIRNKWLFVAYSSKRNSTRRSEQDDYRNEVADHHQYAGSKGIGRFSSDRLGSFLVLQTRPSVEASGFVHRLDVDWTSFEQNDKQEFDLVNIAYHETEQFNVPTGLPHLEHGTVVQISRLAKSWTREDLLKLKAGLAKLINPFGASADGFSISIIAEQEKDEDERIRQKYEQQASDKQDDEQEQQAPRVNGHVGNFIFSTLRQKTTFISVHINAASNTIETSLTDRGEIIYLVQEPNPYNLLRGADFVCQLYSLNRAAKATFARRMGIPSVRFGSVFLFRNGFRVFPIGEEGDDWFGIDRRKQQGFARFLGTRDIIGKIDVSGTDEMFQEASSRNQGLIAKPAVAQLRECFREYCLKRLERYVVPVSWGTKDIDTETTAFIESDSGRTRVSSAIADLIGSENIHLLQYSKRIVNILNERSDQFEKSLVNLRVIANRTKDQELVEQIEEAEKRFVELKQAEAEARRIANEERQAKEEAEERVKIASAEVGKIKDQLGEEQKRNLFLTSITSLDVDTILNMHHSITIYASNLKIQIENLMLRISNRDDIPRDMVVNSLERISLLNQQVLAVARFATKANFRLESEYIEEDLSNYIAEYIKGVARDFLGGSIDIQVSPDSKTFKRKFKPIDVSILVDNLVINARKAKASRVVFDLKQPRKGTLEIRVSDDGRGIVPQALIDNQLFEKGFTTTDGSGLGLYHIRQVLSEMGGSIEVAENSILGASFLMRIPA